ncbi:8548_t:CDS:2, partial [Cetraspora pellucida]
FVAKAWKNVTENVIIHAWQKTEILPSTDLESSIKPNDNDEVDISTRKFIEINNKYMTSEITKIEDIIAEIQEEDDEKEPEKPVKSVTTVQAIAG